MPLYASDFDQSKYLRADEVGNVGAEKRLKIKIATKETDVGEEKRTKAVLWFTTTDKGLMLNKTNLRTLQSAFGDAMDGWVGKIVVVFVTMAEFRGKMVPALRVRIPPPKDGYKAPPPPPKPPADEDDEDVDSFNAPARRYDDDGLEVR
jgi:hypothetical protein